MVPSCSEVQCNLSRLLVLHLSMIFQSYKASHLIKSVLITIVSELYIIVLFWSSEYVDWYLYNLNETNSLI
jgi:hypothetical protein